MEAGRCAPIEELRFQDGKPQATVAGVAQTGGEHKEDAEYGDRPVARKVTHSSFYYRRSFGFGNIRYIFGVYFFRRANGIQRRSRELP